MLGTGNVSEILSNKSPLEIGRDVFGRTEYLIGALDDISVFSSALTDAELKKLASN